MTHTPGSTTFELLTAHPWNLNREIITTDAGDYAYTTDQVSNIHWASFVFNPNLTYVDHGSDKGTFLYYDGTFDSNPTLILTPGNGGFNFNFTIGSISQDSLALDLPKLQVHPLKDMSAGVVAEDNIFLTGLHDDFGVDTSKVQWVQPVFRYNNIKGLETDKITNHSFSRPGIMRG